MGLFGRTALQGPDLPIPTHAGCERDRLAFSACETLRLLGRCQLPTVITQCCRTCHLDDLKDSAHGHHRAARR